MASILTSALLVCPLAFNVSAAETRDGRDAFVELGAFGLEVGDMLTFYHDTSSIYKITKAYATSIYNGNTSTPLSTQNVYMITELVAETSNSITYTKKVITSNFYMNKVSSVYDYSMENSMMTFPSNATVPVLYSCTYLSTFNASYSHTNPNSCPLTSESTLLYLTTNL